MGKTKWIWCAGQDVHGYNLAAQFKKEFESGGVKNAILRITADSRYRVSLNGKWINDGPGKAYAEHWTYDVYDIAPLLKTGTNRIEVTARYYGIGTFHQIPQQAGLLAEIELDGKIIGTDDSWQAAPLTGLRRWSPKVSSQMEPAESVDSRLAGRPDWQPAVELFAANNGPWKDLSPRRSEPLTKNRCRPVAVYSAMKVKKAPQRVCVPVTQIAHPGVIEANQRTSRPVILSAVLTLRKNQPVDFFSKDWNVAVDGESVEGSVTLTAGRHAVLFFCVSFYGHNKELPFPFANLPGARWSAWQVFVNGEFLFRDTDIIWLSFENAEAERVKRGWMTAVNQFSKVWKHPDEKIPNLGKKVDLSLEQLFMEDYTADFAAREPIGSASRLFDGKTVRPARGADVELCYDFGEQRCGYFDFSIHAPSGTVIDLHMVEYIRPDGVVQHTAEFNRNGMRYITKQGINRYVSLKRRSGRFLFITFRNLSAPVEIRRLDIIESTAPVEAVGGFSCSDQMLNRVWQMSERTLQLCMEDTFTDCPLYEQTLWIGDARNEAIYAFTAYGNTDVSARSLELGAQSLEQFLIVGCQVPSSWDCILPAWSFLWGMHVWEHYFFSGDRRLLKKLWPAVQQNIDGALSMLNADGLFSGEFWNLIEWAPIDEAQPTVLHNNMLLVGALRAAEHCAETLKDFNAGKKLAAARKKLVRAIHATWNDDKQSFPDSIRADGTPSPKICQHTSMFPVMFDMIPKGKKEALRTNLLNPPEGMTTVSAPFAMQFMYEALEEFGEYDAVLNSIRAGFEPMVRAGSDTVWETFEGSTCSPKGFPTRSHCHAWSSSPIYFLNRIVLGIRQTAAGGKAFEISPWLGGLRYARGATATPMGPVSVDWKIAGGTLQVVITAPKGVEVEFKSNASHKGLSIGYSVIRS